MLARVFISSDRRLAIWWRLLVAFLLWFAVAILTEELAGNRLGQGAGGLLLMGGTLVLVFALRRGVDRRPWRAMGLTSGSRAAAHALAGFGLGALAIGTVIGVTVATGGVRLDQPNPAGLDAASVTRVVGVLLAYAIGVGFAEELLFRGYFLQNLGETQPVWVALALTSVVFGLLHYLQVHALLPLSAIALGGLVLGLLRLATGTLWMAIGFHAAWNFVPSLFGTSLLPMRSDVPFEQTLAGYVVPLVLVVALLVREARRPRHVDWRRRLDATGRVPVTVMVGAVSGPQSGTAPVTRRVGSLPAEQN